MLAFARTVPILGIRVTLIVSAAILIGASAMAWSGFRYSFSPSGLEIYTLGFRVRSIPSAEIRSYAPDRWNVIGGYGIRGLGSRKAYVWGTSGVRIKTTEGEVFLGHHEPEKITAAQWNLFRMDKFTPKTGRPLDAIPDEAVFTEEEIPFDLAQR